MKNGSINSQSRPVALPEREAGEQLVTSEVTNSPYYNKWIFQLLLYYDDNVGLGSPKDVEKFYKKLERVSAKHLAVAQYIRLNTVTVPSLIIQELDMPEGTVYRIIKGLKKWGLIKYAGSINNRRKKGVKGGPQPEIIAWIDAQIHPEQIAELKIKYYGGINPAMREITKLIPMLIDEYVDPYQKEIKYTQIVSKVKECLPGYSVLPLADECAANLQKIGIKVFK